MKKILDWFATDRFLFILGVLLLALVLYCLMVGLINLSLFIVAMIGGAIGSAIVSSERIE